ncbi:MAG: homocysteine S-methyltransferase family protein [Clostridia bacterium]
MENNTRSKKEILDKINSGYLLLDGAMGTMLQKNGLKLGVPPESFNITHPEIIKKITTDYAKAGALVLTTNTFGANSHKLLKSGYSVKEIITSATQITREVANEYGAFVAQDIGPIGEMLKPVGSLSFEDAYEIIKEQVENTTADIIIIETMTDLNEMRAAVLAAKENTNLPIFCMMTFEQSEDKKAMRTFLGVSPSEMGIVLESLAVDAIGVNCSNAPTEVVEIIKTLKKVTNLPIIAKPNAGLPNINSNDYDLSPEDFAKDMGKLLDVGATIVGGCCGTTPLYIELLKKELDKRTFQKSPLKILPPTVCSSTKTVTINKVCIIGERLNPTGKKLLKEALRSGNTDYILKTAVAQEDAGADILDINVGLPDIDEKKVMITNINALEGVISCPLQIDSSSSEVIEFALRAYNGKAIVNSVNGEDKVLDSILPIVKKYGALVIGLTLNEKGIPPLAKDRFKIAEHILNKALSFGIKKENVIIDCLTLTVSAEQKAAAETVLAIKMVKEKLGLKTVLGVSNISFGLPNREAINSSFLTLALNAGLDLPIVNPNIKSITDSIMTYNILTCKDENCLDFISYSNKFTDKIDTSKNVLKDSTDTKTLLFNAVTKGLKDEAKTYCKELLETTDSMKIVNEILIPALDVVGEQFGNGTLFLPQLLLSAMAVEASFDIIKTTIKKSPSVKGKIILATVKGDIHDIGKNIVKILLENYGYTVIDLGKDVDYQVVLDAVSLHKPFLIGLSALMTTTACNMKTTVMLLKEKFPDCKIVVGGAVITKDYAEKIGADFYAKDAKNTVDIANSLILQNKI